MQDLLPPLQFIVISFLKEEKESSARKIKDKLKKIDINPGDPGFYQLMKRMIARNYVKSHYVNTDSYIKQIFYSLTPKGRKAWDNTLHFYTKEIR